MSFLKAALEQAGMTIRAYDPSKTRSIRTATGIYTVERFSQDLMKALGKKLINHPEVFDGTQDSSQMEKLIEEYAAQELEVVGSSSKTIPAELSHLQLNIDISSNEVGFKKYFCTTQEELLDPTTSGQYYILKCDLKEEAHHIARAVIPKYMPRRNNGVHVESSTVTRTPARYFNSYVPPLWELWKRRNPKEWDALPAKPPEPVIRIIQHVIPNKHERNFFYAWLYTSLVKRAYTFLVLQGDPGIGKNRLKLIMRSLHGSNNGSDGKKETFGANQSKFNSQMEENTFLWFDELKYGPDMEPRMKEYQNDYISIEKKGQDASRSTEIFCSMVISNNHPRDNYLLFNSRKFAPLVLANKPLTAVMSPSDIQEISERLDDTHPNFDVKLVAQVAKWICSIGPKYTPQWPNLEYQGPKFWELCHSSMSRWQKIAVLALTVENQKRGPLGGWDENKKAFLWSGVEMSLRKKKEFESKDYRDAATVRAFFKTYRSMEGKEVFEIEDVNGTIADFWIRPLNGLIKIKGTITLNTNNPMIPERPQGISTYQWNKMKEEFKANQKGLKNEDTNLL